MNRKQISVSAHAPIAVSGGVPSTMRCCKGHERWNRRDTAGAMTLLVSIFEGAATGWKRWRY